MEPELTVRPAADPDTPAILELLALGLGWDTADPRFERFFVWKHQENPFGSSPAWLAHDGRRLAGLRILLRWEFWVDGRRRRAVRAVDTATHPASRGLGVFTRLTLHALDELRTEGVDFVFNTPNDQSRPGYLKMGWREVGRLPLTARPRSLLAPVSMARARAGPPAERWSAPSSAGEPACDVLADDRALGTLLEGAAARGGLTTARSPAYLRWRYGLDLLGYRALAHPLGAHEGIVVFRVRRRGPASEAVLCEALVPGGGRREARALLRRSARHIDAEYIAALGRGLAPAGFVPLPGQGPVLTWRGLDDEPMPPRRAWHLSLGDVELF